MRGRTVLFLALMVAAGIGSARAEEAIWSALVYATNEKNPAPVPEKLVPYARQLETVFGYNQLRLLNEHRVVVKDGVERWLIPGKPFCLRVENKAGKPLVAGDYRLALQLYQDKRLLVQTEAQLGHKCPLFVRGPLYKKGQLVILLVVE